MFGCRPEAPASAQPSRGCRRRPGRQSPGSALESRRAAPRIWQRRQPYQQHAGRHAGRMQTKRLATPDSLTTPIFCENDEVAVPPREAAITLPRPSAEMPRLTRFTLGRSTSLDSATASGPGAPARASLSVTSSTESTQQRRAGQTGTLRPSLESSLPGRVVPLGRFPWPVAPQLTQ